VHLIQSRRKADGRWLLDRAFDEALALPFGESEVEPSRWNMLRALRVLRWYERGGLEPTSLKRPSCPKRFSTASSTAAGADISA